MYWQEENKPRVTSHEHEVVDLVYSLQCKALPVDHSYALSEAVTEVLPWLATEPLAGVHSIHVAASANGWIRPDDPDALLQLSRRTRLMIRVPKHRIEDARVLEGKQIEVAGHDMHIQQAKVKSLSDITTLFTRRFATPDDIASEEDALDWMAGQLQEIGIKPRKMLCGAEHFIDSPDGRIRVRSLMIADLEKDESIRLQEQGIGPYRRLGCGLFIPHKHIHDVRDEKDSD